MGCAVCIAMFAILSKYGDPLLVARNSCPLCLPPPPQVRREMAAELGPDGASAIADLQLPAFDGNVITPGEAGWAVACRLTASEVG